MGIEKTQERHRPGSLKHQNKQHKHGRHKSKGFLETLNKGRTLMRLNSRKIKHELKKDERRNQAVQLRHKKREEALKAKRGFLDAPILTAVISLSKIKADVALAFIKAADSDSVITYSIEGQVHISVPRFKQRFCFVECENENIFDVLDILKVADTLLFVVSVEGISSEGELLLTAALAQGLPTTVVTLVDLLKLPPKKRQDGKMHIQKVINRWLPDEKVMVLEKVSDGLAVLRRIGNQKQRNVIQRDKRPHMLAEKTEYVPDPLGGLGTVKLTGYLKGKPLSVNSLVHIPGWGDLKMQQIDSSPDPHPLVQLKNKDDTLERDEVLEVADPSKQESLDSENIPDPMDGEQTWPTEEEIKEAEENIKKVKRVPAGMSDYQASWIPDSDAEEIDDDDDDDDEDEKMKCDIDPRSEDISEDEALNDTDTMTVTSEVQMPADKYDQETNLTEEQEIFKKIKDARSEQMFPDEVDTPLDIAARVRFQKYRGLKSFRTSTWDVKENLPQDYARIFQFQRFDRTHKRILKELNESTCTSALPDTYITIHVQGISEDLFMSRLGTQPLVVFGMLPHEQKMSVINMVLKRPACLESNEPIKSKEQLIFQCGYRRFKACPIFSEHTNGAKHKYERYFQADGTVVATVFAPIMFPPASVLTFKEKRDGTLNLVATGNLLSVNPDRLVIKRIVLSGHPLKMHKRSAVVRFMFFNREDIEWFKPVELRTKYGRRGHIKEPLGTHGHMKCIFDGQLKSQDTVLLTLYKRVFPKWTYDPVVTVNNNVEMETD